MAEALGLIESRGMVGLVAATDAMAKAAKVQLVKRIEIGGAYVTTVLKGDVGSVRAAVEAGVEALNSSGGELVASNVIAHPSPAVAENFLK